MTTNYGGSLKTGSLSLQLSSGGQSKINAYNDVTVSSQSGSTVNFVFDDNVATTVNKSLTVGTQTLVADAVANTVSIGSLFTADNTNNSLTFGKADGSTSLNLKGPLSTNGSLTVAGNLLVNGTTTTVHSSQVTIDDNLLVLNANPAQTSAAAGIAVQRYYGDVRNVTTDKLAQSGVVTSLTGTASTTAIAVTDTAPTIVANSFSLQNGAVSNDLLSGGLLIFINNTGGTVAGSIRYASATVNAGSYTFTCVGSVTAAIANTANVTVEVWRAAYSGMFYNESAGQFVLGYVNKDLATGDVLNVVRRADAALNNLNAYGSTTISGGLSVAGASSLASLATSGSSTFSGSVLVSGANTFTVGSGFTSLGGALSVSGSSTLGTLNAGSTTVTNLSSGNITLSGTSSLYLNSGAATLGGTLSVFGASTLGTLTAGATTVTTLTTSSNAVINGSTTLNGSVTVSGTNSLNVGGTAYLNGTLWATGAQTLTGATYHASNVTIASATVLSIGGQTTLGNTLYVTGQTTHNATVNITGGAGTLAAGLSVSNGATSLGGSLSVAGTSTLGTLYASASTFSGALVVTGTNSVSIGGAATLNSSLAVTGNTTLTGLSATSATISGSLSTTGSSTLGTLYATSTTLSGNLNITGTNQLNVGGSTSLGSTVNIEGATTLQSTVAIQGQTTYSSDIILKTSTADATGSTFKKLYLSDPTTNDHDYFWMQVATSAGTTNATLQIVQHSISNNTNTVIWQGSMY